MPIRQYVCVLGTTIPWYGICVGVALLVIGIWMIHNFRLFKMNGDEQNAGGETPGPSDSRYGTAVFDTAVFQ